LSLKVFFEPSFTLIWPSAFFTSMTVFVPLCVAVMMRIGSLAALNARLEPAQAG
jgi:hypothetical protein